MGRPPSAVPTPPAHRCAGTPFQTRGGDGIRLVLGLFVSRYFLGRYVRFASNGVAAFRSGFLGAFGGSGLHLGFPLVRVEDISYVRKKGRFVGITRDSPP